ncbi:MAG TPA: NADH-quinone oxidoreductase subunit H [Candidatus Thermoplasmatota archaeon]|nr:NADH-quinone oxidoreductase subunit H [Candidatus Thermoplasmatota archaeon]
MSLAEEAVAALALLVFAPLTVWAERKVKAWSQLRKGPSILQPYRDLRRLAVKETLIPNTSTRLFRVAPFLAAGCVVAALFLLPLYDSGGGLGGSVALLVLALLFTLQRALMAAQAYDAGTAFEGIGSSRELFLGGLGEPVFLLVAAAVYLESGSARVPAQHLVWGDPASWLIVGALAFAWLAEAARIPFDNPATHLELTMVHEALILESSGRPLALYELAGMWKQAILAGLLLLFVAPLPPTGPLRVALLGLGVILLSGVLALFEAGMAKVRLFRASHLLVMAALLAFLGGVVGYVEAGFV